MNIEDQLIDIRTRATISSLWVFFFINHFFMAIHEFANPEFMETLLAGEFAVGDTTLLIAAVALEPTIAMIVLSWVLPSRANWIANVSVAVFAIDQQTGGLVFTGNTVACPTPICVEFQEPARSER